MTFTRAQGTWRVAAILAWACLLAPRSVAQGVAAEAPALRLPPPGSLYHGVYPGGRTGEEDDLTAADAASYERAAGRPVAWIYFSHNWYHGRAFPAATASWIRGRGSVPYIRLMLRSSPEQNRPEPVYTLRAILAGRFDDDLRRWGDAARAFGTPILAEFGTEMNGAWFPWNGKWNGGPGLGPQRFRRAYRRIVEIVRSRGATNVLWVFHVNADDWPAAAWNRFETYYPGDDVVDWLGVSVYGAQTPLDGEWPLFAAGMDGAVPRLAALAPGKPIIVCEFGVTSGNPLGDPARWADNALRQLIAGRWRQIVGFSWWNETWQNDEDPAHDTDMRVQTVPGLRQVFQRRLASPKVIDRPIVTP